MIGPKGLQFLWSDGSHPGYVITKLVKIGLFANSSQMIGPKGLQFLWSDGSHPEEVITKFD